MTDNEQTVVIVGLFLSVIFVALCAMCFFSPLNGSWHPVLGSLAALVALFDIGLLMYIGDL